MFKNSYPENIFLHFDSLVISTWFDIEFRNRCSFQTSSNEFELVYFYLSFSPKKGSL